MMYYDAHCGLVVVYRSVPTDLHYSPTLFNHTNTESTNLSQNVHNISDCALLPRIQPVVVQLPTATAVQDLEETCRISRWPSFLCPYFYSSTRNSGQASSTTCYLYVIIPDSVKKTAIRNLQHSPNKMAASKNIKKSNYVIAPHV